MGGLKGPPMPCTHTPRTYSPALDPNPRISFVQQDVLDAAEAGAVAFRARGIVRSWIAPGGVQCTANRDVLLRVPTCIQLKYGPMGNLPACVGHAGVFEGWSTNESQLVAGRAFGPAGTRRLRRRQPRLRAGWDHADAFRHGRRQHRRGDS